MTAARIVALYDANVLYPAPLRDFLIRLARADLVSARWTDRIHDEWIRSLLRDRPDLTSEQLARTRALMDAAVPGALVEQYDHRIAELDLPDPDDRHVLAAAIVTDADLIVTFNTRDFPARVAGRYGIRAVRPDALCLDLLATSPDAVHAVVRSHRSALRKPPKTVDEYLATLASVGLPRTVEGLRASGVDL